MERSFLALFFLLEACLADVECSFHGLYFPLPGVVLVGRLFLALFFLLEACLADVGCSFHFLYFPLPVVVLVGRSFLALFFLLAAEVQVSTQSMW